MPLKPSARAEACRLLAAAYEQAQAALLSGDGDGQIAAWETVEAAVAEAHRALAPAAVEAMRAAFRKSDEEQGRRK